MTHLGTQLSALADGQLPPASAERALAHVAACPECADGLRAARAARRTLADAFEVRPAPDLTARLMALGAAMPQPPDPRATRRTDAASSRPAASPAAAGRPGCERDVVRARAAGSVPLPGTTARLPAGCLDGELGRRGMSPRRLAAAGAGLAAVCLVLLALGGQVVVAPQRHPAHALTVLGRAGVVAAHDAQVRSAARGPAVAQAATSVPSTAAERAEGLVREWAAERPWSLPLVVPPGHVVVGARVDPDGVEGLEVDLLGPHGLVVVTQTHGVLDPRAVAAGTAAPAHAGAEGVDGVHLLSTAPWHAVWQHDDVVVSVVAEVESQAVEELVAAYPAQASDDGVPARLVRGWQVLAGAWSVP